MIKREVERGFFSGNISAIAAEGMNKQSYFFLAEQQYPCDDGWEIVGSHLAGVNGNSIGLVLVLAKYVYEPE